MNTLPRNSEKVKMEKANGPKVLRSSPANPPGAQSGGPWSWSVHWLTFTVWDEPGQVFSALGEAFPALREMHELGYGGLGYRRQSVLSHGVRVWWEPVKGEQRATVSLPGAVLEGVELQTLFQFMKGLRQAARVRITRLGIAFDAVPFTPKDVLDAFLSGRVRTVAHRDSWDWYEDPYGRTFTIGARSSPRYLRVYDARGTTRLEMGVRGERVDTLFWLLVDEENPARFFLEFVRGYIDFCEPNGANRSRGPFLDWWEALYIDEDKREGRACEEARLKRR